MSDEYNTCKVSVCPVTRCINNSDNKCTLDKITLNHLGKCEQLNSAPYVTQLRRPV